MYETNEKNVRLKINPKCEAAICLGLVLSVHSIDPLFGFFLHGAAEAF